MTLVHPLICCTKLFHSVWWSWTGWSCRQSEKKNFFFFFYPYIVWSKKYEGSTFGFSVLAQSTLTICFSALHTSLSPPSLFRILINAYILFPPPLSCMLIKQILHSNVLSNCYPCIPYHPCVLVHLLLASHLLCD